MSALARAVLFLGFAAAASAQPAPDLPDLPVPRSSPGWTRQGKSLLLYDPEGALISEVGLVVGEEVGGRVREVVGGTSPDGRAAWTLERRVLWNPNRSKVLESRRSFKLFGSQGQSLWEDDLVEMPETGDPVAFSADGKVVMIARREGEAWTVEARDWAGIPIKNTGGFPKLQAIHLAPAGRFALIRWAVPDRSSTHTFLDLKTGARKDVDSSSLVLGMARIGDDGVARSGMKVVFAFALTAPAPAAPALAPPAAEIAPATTPAPAPSTGPVPAPTLAPSPGGLVP